MGQRMCSCIKASEHGDPLAGTLPPETTLKPIFEQNYAAIKEQCLKKGKLFEDPLFPASSRSLSYHLTPRLPKQWMRPKEIAVLMGAQPEFFVRGGAASDLIQGELGNCWVVAAACSLADHPTLLDRVAPSDQTFSGADYAGIFRFNFYVYGHWIEVVVDDRLPTDQGRMTYVHSSQPNEFWGALLEKAYAKLFGCYQALTGGVCADALTSFTGGVTETYRLKADTPPNIGRILLQAVDIGSLICTGIWGSENLEMENGLVTGHAFSVTAVEQVDLITENRFVTLIKLRNPWANQIEWRGRWGDRSRAWAYVSEETRAKLQYRIRDDGEFWMDLNDFVQNFDQLDICHMTHDSAPNTTLRRWQATSVHGAWVRKKTAGGRLKYYDTFASNPQFEFQIGDLDFNVDDKQIVGAIVELTQKHRRSRVPYNPLYIGFVVYQLHNDHIPPMPALFFQEQPRVGAVDIYANSYIVTKRFHLSSGRYLVVPSTWDPDEEGSFLLRVWSQAIVRTASDATMSSSGTSYNYPTWNTKRDKKNQLKSNHVNEEPKNKNQTNNGHSEPLLAFDQSSFGNNPGNIIENPKLLTRMSTQLSEVQSRSAYKLLKSYAGRDMMMNAEQLQRGLNSSYAKGKAYRFALDCCRSLISLVDEKFRSHDKRRNGHLDNNTFGNSLYELCLLPLSQNLESHLSGVSASITNPNNTDHSKWLQPIFQRFSDRSGRASYSEFISCCSKLSMTDQLLSQYKSRYADGLCSMSPEQVFLTLLKS